MLRIVVGLPRRSGAETSFEKTRGTALLQVLHQALRVLLLGLTAAGVRENECRPLFGGLQVEDDLG